MTAFHENIFDRRIDFDPSADSEVFLKSVPAKWVVYLMTDADDRPVQLLCVKNLRYSLERRLETSGAEEGPSRRVSYREIVRRVYWRRVDSSFEADVVYLEAARTIFPETYRGMTGFRPAWFVHVNPEAAHPRYIKTHDPTSGTGLYLGPLEDKHAAQRLVHLAESLFDLCRDYSILVQSPAGGPCAWKQMNKCVGPCDGTIDLNAYRALVTFSTQVLSNPHDYIREQICQMRLAAAELQFETAKKIKAYIEQLSDLGKGAFRHVRPLAQFNYLTLQHGPRAGMAKVFLITPGRVDEIVGLISEPVSFEELLPLILGSVQARREEVLDDAGAERIGVVAHHLFQPKAKQGVFLPIESSDGRSIAKAYRDLQNQKPQDEVAGEGVTQELQAL